MYIEWRRKIIFFCLSVCLSLSRSLTRSLCSHSLCVVLCAFSLSPSAVTFAMSTTNGYFCTFPFLHSNLQWSARRTQLCTEQSERSHVSSHAQTSWLAHILGHTNPKLTHPQLRARCFPPIPWPARWLIGDYATAMH